MRLSAAALAGLFALGAAGGLLGDQGHVASGTTAYLPSSKGVPFVWESPLWFPALVGLLTASLAEARLRLAPTRRAGGAEDGVAAVAAVLGLYALTALIRHQPLGALGMAARRRVSEAGWMAEKSGFHRAIPTADSKIQVFCAFRFDFALFWPPSGPSNR